MAYMAAGQSSSMADQLSLENNSNKFPSLPMQTMEPIVVTPSTPLMDYVNILKSKLSIHGICQSCHEVKPIPIKRPNFIKGVPQVRWTEEEVDRIKMIEGLQYEVIGKF
ncbi:hypothetical protein FXO38_35275 [Capsicum annuum]|nr:hypothetical protein FXO38_35275 [Capsicum annuum]